MSREGTFRYTPDIDALTPFPVPWSYPDEDATKRPKYPAFKNKPFPMSQFRYKPLTWDPFPHRKNPDVKGVAAKHQLTLTVTKAKQLSGGRMFLTLSDGSTVVARLRLRPGEKIVGSTNVYVAKVLTPKQAGTIYSLYILRLQPDQPVDPGNKAGAEARMQYIEDLLKYQYRFDRAGYWQNVKLVKQWRLEQQDKNRQRYERALEKAKAQYYKDQAAARIAYEKEVSEAQAKYKRALLEYQVSKIGSYYGNKYFSLYGSYHS